LYDFYKILEISRDASNDDIRRAYRSKAKMVHPDVNPSPKAAEVFAVVNEAYENLIDDQRRYLHDVKLNYADAARLDAEKKRQYYGSSLRNNTYTNAFHYDWESTAKAYKEKTDEDYYNENPFLYNLLFVSGMILGFVIIFVTAIGTWKNYWPFPFSAIGVAGIILVREGWRGMLGKKNIMQRLLRKRQTPP
jgi:hypothetical protein